MTLNPRSVDEVFKDFKGRRSGMLKALTTGRLKNCAFCGLGVVASNESNCCSLSAGLIILIRIAWDECGMTPGSVEKIVGSC